MAWRKFKKPSVWLPIIVGIVLGSILFMLGDADDSPGLSFIGLILAFVLIMKGVYKAEIIRQGFFTPVILFLVGMGGIIFSIALLLDKEFEQYPYIGIMGIILGIVLILGGLKLLLTRRKKAD